MSWWTNHRGVAQTFVDLGSSVRPANPVHVSRLQADYGWSDKTCWARVEMVDPELRVARVRGLSGDPFVALATWCSPYAHGGSKSEGFDFIPREDAICLVQRVARQYVIVGFAVPSAGAVRGKGQTGFAPDHAGLRPRDYAVGDQVWGTVDNNFIAMTSDGAIELFCRALTRFILDPLHGLGRLFLKNYELFTEGGYEKWWNFQEGDKRSEWTGLYKDTPVSGEDNQVVIKKGKNGDIFEMRILKRIDAETLEEKARIHIDPDGKMIVQTDGDFTLKVEEDALVSVDGDATIVAQGDLDIGCGGDMNILAVGNIAITGKEIDLTSTG